MRFQNIPTVNGAANTGTASFIAKGPADIFGWNVKIGGSATLAQMPLIEVYRNGVQVAAWTAVDLNAYGVKHGLPDYGVGTTGTLFIPQCNLAAKDSGLFNLGCMRLGGNGADVVEVRIKTSGATSPTFTVRQMDQPLGGGECPAFLRVVPSKMTFTGTVQEPVLTNMAYGEANSSILVGILPVKGTGVVSNLTVRLDSVEHTNVNTVDQNLVELIGGLTTGSYFTQCFEAFGRGFFDPIDLSPYSSGDQKVEVLATSSVAETLDTLLLYLAR